MHKTTMTAEERSISLMHALGWQGGTIHDAARTVGCEFTDILNMPINELDKAYTYGWFAVRTCDRDYLLNKLLAKHQGNVQFWLGVCRGQQLKDCGI